jgi:hypothetical protein
VRPNHRHACGPRRGEGVWLSDDGVRAARGGIGLRGVERKRVGAGIGLGTRRSLVVRAAGNARERRGAARSTLAGASPFHAKQPHGLLDPFRRDPTTGRLRYCVTAFSWRRSSGLSNPSAHSPALQAENRARRWELGLAAA